MRVGTLPLSKPVYRINVSYITGLEKKHHKILQILEMKTIFYSIFMLQEGKIDSSLNVIQFDIWS
jgi:hypothetical protein